MTNKQMLNLTAIIYMAPAIASKSPIESWLIGVFFIVLSLFTND